MKKKKILKYAAFLLKEHKHKNLIKYLLIGAVMFLITTLVLSLFVDLLGFKAALINPPLYVAIFFLKFFTYKKTKTFNSNKRNFILYTLITLGVLIASTLFLWIFVDRLGFSVKIVNPIVITFVIIMRFSLFKLFKILEE